MSRPTPGSTNHKVEMHTGKPSQDHMTPRSGLPGATLLLQPAPEDMLDVELIDHPISDLPTEQFEALLVDSECEV